MQYPCCVVFCFFTGVCSCAFENLVARCVVLCVLCTGIPCTWYLVYKYTYNNPQPYPIHSWSADLSRLWPSSRAVCSPRHSSSTPEALGVGGSASSAPWRPREALMLRSTKESPKIPALSVFWAMVSRQSVYIRMVLSGTSSPTSNPLGGSPTRPASPLWGPSRVVVSRTPMERPDSTCHPDLVENCHP